MKKSFLIAAIGLLSVSVFAKEIKISVTAQASALGQIADKNLAGKEATSMIKSLLNGQNYEVRLSIIDTVCNQKMKSLVTECNLSIGIDDMDDEDRGWGSIYSLQYLLDTKGQVTKATLKETAG